MGVKEQMARVIKASILNPDKATETVILINPAGEAQTAVEAQIEWFPELENHDEESESREKMAIVSISTAASNGVVGVEDDWTMTIAGEGFAIESTNPDKLGMNDITVKRNKRIKVGGQREAN